MAEKTFYLMLLEFIALYLYQVLISAFLNFTSLVGSAKFVKIPKKRRST
jgi:hypothetical protein